MSFLCDGDTLIRTSVLLLKSCGCLIPSLVITGSEDSELLRIERLTVEADLDADKLATDGLPLKTHRILLDGVNVNTRLLEDGTPSITELLPMPKFGPVTPRMEIRRLRLHLVDDDSRSRPMIASFPEVLVVRTPDRKSTRLNSSH